MWIIFAEMNTTSAEVKMKPVTSVNFNWFTVYYHLSDKLQCYTGISGLEKSRNNTRENIRYFFTCVDIANQLLTHHSPLAPLGQVDEWTAKPSRFSIQVVCRSFLKSWRLNTKKSVSLTDSEVQTFLEGEENQYTKRKTESYVFSGFGVSISLGWEWKSTTGRFATDRFWPFTWKTSFVGKDKVNKWEFCNLKITIIVDFVIMIQRIFSS